MRNPGKGAEIWPDSNHFFALSGIAVGRALQVCPKTEIHPAFSTALMGDVSCAILCSTHTLLHASSVACKVVTYIDRFFPSSKLCSACGHKNTELALSDRRWVCTGCGVIHDRDLNAAINIEREGTSSLNLGAVRPAILVKTGMARAA